ncbi:LysR family transcriptional regulator [Paenibacillus beijingensis]|uniref:LysR family transcriptional regulator n=1 Tax=Paenibacillus beijingensis TaxID=1126833 RepID=A0A0D5NMD2_9BACL|nr:LysR family transcriptional regulator [Paenibacillus beijingensis]AJY76310.1 LysR family transcriptional regulator [Paenibacillus beijingensis]
MESGELKVFQAVAREGSVTQAACRLGYVQSNVTARIQQLELELGKPLFHRSKRGMTLTAAGQSLLKYADKILFLLDAALSEMMNDDIPSGLIKLGSIETAAAVHLPPLMLDYRKQYPDVKLSLFSAYSTELIQKVIRHELDGAFVSSPVQHPELEQLPVFHEEIVLVSEPGEEELAEVLIRPLLFFGAGCHHLERLESWLKEERRTVPEIMQFGSLEAIIGGVAAGLGISVLPRSTIRKREEEGALRVIEIPDKYRFATVHFIYRRDHFFTCAFRKFVEQLGIRAGQPDQSAS